MDAQIPKLTTLLLELGPIRCPVHYTNRYQIYIPAPLQFVILFLAGPLTIAAIGVALLVVKVVKVVATWTTFIEGGMLNYTGMFPLDFSFNS